MSQEYPSLNERNVKGGDLPIALVIPNRFKEDLPNYIVYMHPMNSILDLKKIIKLNLKTQPKTYDQRIIYLGKIRDNHELIKDVLSSKNDKEQEEESGYPHFHVMIKNVKEPEKETNNDETKQISNKNNPNNSNSNPWGTISSSGSQRPSSSSNIFANDSDRTNNSGRFARGDRIPDTSSLPPLTGPREYDPYPDCTFRPLPRAPDSNIRASSLNPPYSGGPREISDRFVNEPYVEEGATYNEITGRRERDEYREENHSRPHIQPEDLFESVFTRGNSASLASTFNMNTNTNLNQMMVSNINQEFRTNAFGGQNSNRANDIELLPDYYQHAIVNGESILVRMPTGTTPNNSFRNLENGFAIPENGQRRLLRLRRVQPRRARERGGILRNIRSIFSLIWPALKLAIKLAVLLAFLTVGSNIYKQILLAIAVIILYIFQNGIVDIQIEFGRNDELNEQPNNNNNNDNNNNNNNNINNNQNANQEQHENNEVNNDANNENPRQPMHPVLEGARSFLFSFVPPRAQPNNQENNNNQNNNLPANNRG